MKAYLVELYTELLPNCGLLKDTATVFGDQASARRFLKSENRRLKNERHRTELWLIRTQELHLERLEELINTEDIWQYLVQRVEKLE